MQYDSQFSPKIAASLENDISLGQILPQKEISIIETI